MKFKGGTDLQGKQAIRQNNTYWYTRSLPSYHSLYMYIFMYTVKAEPESSNYFVNYEIILIQLLQLPLDIPVKTRLIDLLVDRFSPQRQRLPIYDAQSSNIMRKNRP